MTQQNADSDSNEFPVVARQRGDKLVLVQIGNEEASITSDYSVAVGN